MGGGGGGGGGGANAFAGIAGVDASEKEEAGTETTWLKLEPAAARASDVRIMDPWERAVPATLDAEEGETSNSDPGMTMFRKTLCAVAVNPSSP